jgi:uncharacterized membrane protein YhaH (DUF805 family)
MGAIGEIFGFDGRINRLGYLWRSIVAALVISLLAGIAAAGLVFLIRPEGLGGFEDVAQKVAIGGVLLALWSGFALASRRLRDMGLEPAHIVPVFAALWVVNAALLEPLSRVDPERFGLAEGAWVVVQLVTAIPLLFWPSREAPAPVVVVRQSPAPTSYLNWRQSN